MAYTRIRSSLLWGIGLTCLVITLFQFRHYIATMVLRPRSSNSISSSSTGAGSKAIVQVSENDVTKTKLVRRRPAGRARMAGQQKIHTRKEVTSLRARPGLFFNKLIRMCCNDYQRLPHICGRVLGYNILMCAVEYRLPD